MQQVLVNKQKKVILDGEETKFSSHPALHLIAITARAKGKKQISIKATDDEDLIIKIDNNVFPKLTETIKDKIISKAQEFGLDPELMLKIAQRESQLDPRAISPKGAKGIYQLTDITIKQIKTLGFVVRDPYDINQNIIGGMMYFKWLYGLYEGETGQLEKTLAAWNWGMANFSRKEPLDWKILPKETREFIRYVIDK